MAHYDKHTASGLVRHVQKCLLKGWVYLYGGIGQMITQDVINQVSKMYPGIYTQDYINKCVRNIGKVGVDCTGLIETYINGVTNDWNTDKASGEAAYNYDVSAAGMYSEAQVKGPINTMPQTPGLIVYNGNTGSSIKHIGVYIGNNKIIEAKGIDYGVREIPFVASQWSHWFQNVKIDYTDNSGSGSGTNPGETPTGKFKVGDVVIAQGRGYSSEDGTVQSTQDYTGRRMIVQKATLGQSWSKHPYGLSREDSAVIMGFWDEDKLTLAPASGGNDEVEKLKEEIQRLQDKINRAKAILDS